MLYSVLCFYISINCLSAQTRYLAKNIDDSNGLPNTDVWDVYRDSRGYYWIASLNGLSRYDGYATKTYQHSSTKSNTIASNWCLQIAEYKNNYLIINNYNAFSIYRYDYDNFISVNLESISPEFSNTSISKFRISADNKLYIGLTDGSVLIYQESEIQQIADKKTGNHKPAIHRFSHLQIPVNSNLENIILDASGNLWLCYRAGLFVAHQFNTVATNDLTKVSDELFSASNIDKDQRLWFSSYAGDLISVINKEGKFEIHSHQNEIKSQISIPVIGFSDIEQDHSNTYYIGLNNGGFITAKLIQNQLRVIDHTYNDPALNRNEIISNGINALSISDNQVLCIATSEGISFINLQSIQLNNYAVLYKESLQPFSKSATKILPVHDKFLCGTETEGVYCLTLDSVKHKAFMSPVITDKVLVYDMLFDPTTDLTYIATEKGLLTIKSNDLLSGKPLHQYDYINTQNNPTLRSNVIISLSMDKNRVLWLGTGRGLNYLDTKSGMIYSVEKVKGADKINGRNIIRDIAIDQNGFIWLATENGLLSYNHSLRKSENYRLPDSTDEQIISTLFIDSKNSLWVGTGAGLYVKPLESSTFNKITNPYKNINFSIRGITENENQEIWVSSESGLYNIKNKKIEARFSKNDGLNSNIFNYNSIIHTEDGFIVTGSKRGIHIFDESAVTKYPAQASLIVSDIKRNEISIFSHSDTSLVYSFRKKGIVKLPAGSNFFSVEYALLGSPFSENVIYQYKLEGLTDEWLSIGTRNQVNFSNIKHGCYKFYVRASVNSSDWIYTSEPVEINIAPYFYQTWWFRLTIGMLLAFILSIFIYLRFLTIQANKERELAFHKAKMTEMFLANMNHEIRTPLNAISGLTKLLIEKQPRNDQYTYLHAMQQSSDHLTVIINDILDIAKIDSGKMNIEPHTFDIDECVQHIEETLKIKAIDKNLQFHVQRAPDMHKYIYGDSTRLIQVLYNLISNAIKFTESGSVEVFIKSVNPEKPNQQPRLYVSIADTGIGIPASKHNLIFESFTQADSDTTRKYGGTGLGLAICKSLIELQGGRIWFESKVGEGTTFYFDLPYTPSTSENVTRLDSKSMAKYAREMNGMRLLLVEDNEFNRMVAVETIKYYFPGIVIEYAVNGLEAIKKYRVNDYDLIIMDLQMPEMDGYEATRFIRTQFPDHKKDIFILAMTANAFKPDIARVYEVGMNEFLPKPFEIHNLALKMSTAYRLRKLQAASASPVNGNVNSGNV